MSGRAAREEMLRRLRSSAGASCALPVETTPAPGEASIDHFAAALAGVAGRVHHCRTADEIPSAIAALLPESAARLGVRWRTPLLDRLLGAPDLDGGWEWTAAPAPDAGDDAREHWRRAASRASIGVTEADYGISDTGTLVLGSGAGQGRLASLLPPVHVAILPAERLLPDLASLIRVVRDDRPELGPCLTLVTGPSRTADIEKRLVLGAHGPAELHVVVCERAP